MRQHPRPTKIRKCDRELSVTVSYSDPLHGKVHHDIKFQAIMENFKAPWNVEKLADHAYGHFK